MTQEDLEEILLLFKDDVVSNFVVWEMASLIIKKLQDEKPNQ